MEKLFTPLKKYCQETGLPLYSIYNAIFHEDETHIVASGALIRCGGRWFVDHDKMKEHMKENARKWAEQRAATGPKRRKIHPPHRQKVGA